MFKKTGRKGYFPLKVETVNTNDWIGLRRRLGQSDCHLILAQEHHRLACQVCEYSDIALRLGWKSLWAPAVEAVGKAGGAGVSAVAAAAAAAPLAPVQARPLGSRLLS